MERIPNGRYTNDLVSTISDRYHRLQGVLVRMFNFAAERGILEHSPLAGMKKKPKKACTRVLTDEEIKLLWQALDLDNMTMDIYRVSKLALKMILLTDQRPGEVAVWPGTRSTRKASGISPPSERKAERHNVYRSPIWRGRSSSRPKYIPGKVNSCSDHPTRTTNP